MPCQLTASTLCTDLWRQAIMIGQNADVNGGPSSRVGVRSQRGCELLLPVHVQCLKLRAPCVSATLCSEGQLAEANELRRSPGAGTRQPHAMPVAAVGGRFADTNNDNDHQVHARNLCAMSVCVCVRVCMHVCTCAFFLQAVSKWHDWCFSSHNWSCITE